MFTLGHLILTISPKENLNGLKPGEFGWYILYISLTISQNHLDAYNIKTSQSERK